ncbi:DENN domain-containing protein 2B-like isoform X2 [Amblyomma americanum]
MNGPPRRPQRLKRASPVPRASPLVQKLRARFEPADGGRAQPNGKGRPESGGAAHGDDRTPSVLQRARHYELCSVRPNGVDAMLSPQRVAASPPVKPPRTFAHDVYARMKEQMRPNPLYGRAPLRRLTAPSLDDSAVAHDYDEVCVGEPSGVGLRRSRSDENIYAQPGAPRSRDQPRELHYMVLQMMAIFDAAAMSTCLPMNGAASTEQVCSADLAFLGDASPLDLIALPALERFIDWQPWNLPHKHDLHKQLLYPATPGSGADMAARRLHLVLFQSSPISGAAQDGPLSPRMQRGVTSQIRDAIRQSFTLARQQLSPRSPAEAGDAHADSSSEVSAREVQKRLVYVRSIKRAYGYGPSCNQLEAEKVFEFTLLVGYRRIDCAMPPQPDVLHRFPKETDCPGYDPVVIAHLCMPQEFDSEDGASAAERFFFTLVRDSGEKTFFHCLQLPKGHKGALGGSLETPLVLCLATRASSVAFYHQLLGDLAGPLVSLSETSWSDLLSSLAQERVPSPGCRLGCRAPPGQGGVTLATTRPVDDRYDWARLTPLLGALELPVLMRIVSSLILERRIILVSDDSTLVRRWVESVECLVYPFKWAHVRVPLVPRSLLAQCSSPEPYLLGVPAAMVHTALELLAGPVLVVDVDRGALLCEDEDNRDVVPQKLQQSLSTALSLAKNMTDPTGQVRDMMITEAFVRLFVELVGHCDQHISLSDDLRESSFQGCSSSVQRSTSWIWNSLAEGCGSWAGRSAP